MQNPLVEKLMRKGVPASALASPSAAGESQGQEGGLHGFQLAKDAKTGGIIVDDRFRARLSSSSTTPSSTPPPSSSATTLDGAQSSQGSARRNRPLLPDVFVIGDCAVVDTQPALPKTAQVASQEAAHLARALNRQQQQQQQGRPGSSSNRDEAWGKPFRFRNLGTMTYLGNWRAIHQSSADRLTGYAAWVLWRTAYLTRSMSLKNKVLIPVYVSL